MPNITEFNAGDLSIRPSETGVEALAAAGRRAGAFYNQEAEAIRRTGSELGRGLTEAGDVAVNYETHQQVSAGAATGAQLFSDQLEKKDAAIKAIDPNDPLYGQKVQTAVKQWREESLEPALQQFAGGFTTTEAQKWAQSFIDRTRDTMFVHSTADIQTAAGIGIHNSARTLVNTATATAFRDPTMLASQIDLVDHGVTGLVESNPVKGVEAGKVQSSVMEAAKEQIVKSAVQGAIMNGGNWKAIANDPRYSEYVNASEMAQFERAQRTQDRFAVAQQKSIELSNRQLATYNLETSVNDLYAKYHHVGPDGKEYFDAPYGPELNDLIHKYHDAPNASNIIGEHLKHFEDIVNPRREAVTTDPAVSSALDANMFAEQGKTTEMDILKAENNHTLSTADANIKKQIIKLRDQMPSDPMFKYAVDGAKASIEGTTAGDKALAAGKFPAFMQSFMQEYLKERNAGTLKPNALDLNDENSLINQMIKPFSLENNIGGFIKQNGGIGAPPPAAAPKSGGYVIPGQT